MPTLNDVFIKLTGHDIREDHRKTPAVGLTPWRVTVRGGNN